MAHGPLKEDPAINRFNTMRESAYLRFRWTPTTVRTTMLGFVLVPLAIYYIADRHDARWDWTAKRRGESLAIRSE
ncbi:hypothetical protein Agabi119p4_3532 [Agaricus bisporus var. burnettii]|uniref:NADH-ubiquinone oxidoreductase B15 subunit n=1 Tax=Agaricus bisporus var. burnettii TaxID=192524 RepID=A0A8H7KI70_AGABI|nr:hypothetical protein Agabi119p4_3532 [Agaricus bisporus var. burnettii]